MNIRIETSRLILRPLAESDAAAVSRNSRQPSVARFMPDMVYDNEESAIGWIRWSNNELFDTDKPAVLLAVIRKSDGLCMGCIFVHRKEEWDNVVEMGYYIADEFQNNGYATEAGKAMIWWAFDEAGQDMLSAFVKPDNTASRRVIEKLGFIYVDTRMLPHDGEDCAFDCFRLYNIDDLPGPEWDSLWAYETAEEMGEFFNKRAAGYDDTRVSYMSSGYANSDYVKYGSFLPESLDALKVLNVGCGTGFELPYIWERMPNAHITCLDLSRGMLDLLLDKYRDKHEQITVVEASYIDWAYPEAAFDIVTSHSTMHHLWPEKIEVYRKIRRTLIPGGVYIEADFIVGDVLATQYKRRYEAITAGLPNKAAAGEYHIDIPCALDVQIKLLRDAGFSTVEVLDDSTGVHGSGAILQARR